MSRAIQEPTSRKESRPGGEVQEVLEHPAFGQIAAHRVSGAANLYGSDFTHQHFVVIEIHHSELYRNLSSDWHFSRNEIVEVALSEAQWATFVSSMNVGKGVPCTIQHEHGKMIPGLPERKTFGIYADEASASVQDAVRSLEELRATALHETSKLPKKARDEILGYVDVALRRLSDSLPFVKKQFDEHIETVVEKAKGEVNAYATATLMRAGAVALQGNTEPPVLIAGGSADVE